MMRDEREVPLSMSASDRHQVRRLIEGAHDQVDAERRCALLAIMNQDLQAVLRIEKRRGDTLRKALLVAMAYGALMTAAVLGLWSVR